MPSSFKVEAEQIILLRLPHLWRSLGEVVNGLWSLGQLVKGHDVWVCGTKADFYSRISLVKSEVFVRKKCLETIFWLMQHHTWIPL